jgi:hypothetical protein
MFELDVPIRWAPLAGAAAILAGCVVDQGTQWPGRSTPAADRGGADRGGSDPHGGTRDAAGAAGAVRPGSLAAQRPCTPEDDKYARDRGLTGPCLDPPGPGKFTRDLTMTSGMRPMGTDDWGYDLYWFDMPAEARLETSYRCAEIPGAMIDGAWTVFTPYAAEDGFPRPAIGDYQGVAVDQALARLDALDATLCVTVIWDDSCTAGHGLVCKQSPALGERGDLTLTVGKDIRDAGTARETRRRPDVTGMPTDDAVAELRRRGFTRVEVVEADVACERGVVCDVSPAVWSGDVFFAPGDPITLRVRKGRP